MTSNRKCGLDIIRTLAITIVMITHAFNYTGLLGQNLRSPSWTALASLKFFAIIGVPLFLLLTGFLQSKREFGKKHYTSIIPVLLSYFVISALSVLAEKLITGSETSVFQYIVNILDFEYGYAWYVEMYIGLFLLIPFLNYAFKASTKKQKLWLIGMLSFLSFIPASLQYVQADGIALEIFPDFFVNLYVLAYYFIGSYIAEYKPSPKKLLLVAVIALTIGIETVLCYTCSSEQYAWWLFNNVASVTHAIVAVCVFLLFYDVTIRSKPVAAVFKRIATFSFEMYLISYMTDYFCHTYLTLPLWAVLITDFAIAFVGAGILRLVIVPTSNFLKNL